jgi:hypothetical protein
MLLNQLMKDQLMMMLQMLLKQNVNFLILVEKELFQKGLLIVQIYILIHLVIMIDILNHGIMKEDYLNDHYTDEKILLYLINKHIDEHKHFELNNLCQSVRDGLMEVTKN